MPTLSVWMRISCKANWSLCSTLIFTILPLWFVDMMKCLVTMRTTKGEKGELGS